MGDRPVRPLTRRSFLGAGSAFALLGGGCAFRAPCGMFGGGGLRLRFGVMSDIHLNSPGDDIPLRNALWHFFDNDVDGVLIAGDIADTGRICQLRMLADAWNAVFPDDAGRDGRRVEKLFVYGNHCVEAWRWGEPYKGKEDLAAKEAIGYGGNRARAWEAVFHEKYEPIWMKQVKGYTFVGAHWKDDRHVDIEAFLSQRGGEIDPALPFFYTQHAHPKDTCYGAWAWGHDDGASTRALSRFPNAVAFSGHSHYTLTDDRTVWQGAFTSVNTASMRRASLDYSLRDNINKLNPFGYTGEAGRPKPQPWFDRTASQGMMVSVYDDRLVIERREFETGHSLGEDWVVPLPLGKASRPFAYAEQAKRRTAPEFAADARLEVGFAEEERPEIGKVVELKCPRAAERGGCRVFEYEVTAVLEEDDVDLIQVQRRFIAPDFHLPLARRVPQCVFHIPLGDLPLKGRYRFRVVPMESFGSRGAPLWSERVRVG